MKRLTLALGIIITMALTVTAQGVDGIKRNSSYLYGEGGGVTLQAAKEAALADLIQKISVTVHSDFTSKERELNQDGNVTSDAEYQSIIRSYSTATLTNVKTIVLKPEPDASVFLYIAKSEIDRIFESRVAKAKEFVGNADEALKNGQIDDALRYYYWNYCLVKSLRYPNEAKIFVDGQERSLLAWLPTRIDDVMGKVKVQSRRTADNTYEITATYDGRPVRSMDYTYFDGVDNSPVYSILDGKGLVELRPGMAMDAVQLKLEYEFRGLSRNDSEVEAVVGAMKPAVYRRAYHRVALDGAASPAESTSTDVNGSMQSPLALTDMGTLGTAVMKPVMQALRSGSIEQCRQKFTAEGWEEFSKLMGYGKVTLMDDIHLDYFADGDCVVCRGLPVSCRFNRGRVFNEKLSFYIDSNSKQITHVAMGLGREAMNDVVLGHLDWSEKSRTRIVGFLEDYRTAYATKNLEGLRRQCGHRAREAAAGGSAAQQGGVYEQPPRAVHAADKTGVPAQPAPPVPVEGLHKPPLLAKPHLPAAEGSGALRHRDKAGLLLFQLWRHRLPDPDFRPYKPGPAGHSCAHMAGTARPEFRSGLARRFLTIKQTD